MSKPPYWLDEQPEPQETSGPAIWDLVIQDMKERDQVGRKRYGVPLQANNGRDALKDGYAEVLDLCVYLRQAIEERGAVAESRSVIWQAFQDDPGFKQSYVANAACILLDYLHIDDWQQRNDVAEILIDRLFGP